MVKKCSKCGEIKDVKQFRLMENKNRRCAYCKQCEGIYTKEYRDKCRKQNVKRQIIKKWTELCEDMDAKELDKELFNLREIYKQVKELKHE